MTHPDPERRPTAFQILKHSAVCSSSNKTKEQLERELQAEKTKTQILEKKLKAFSTLFKTKMLGESRRYLYARNFSRFEFRKMILCFRR